MEPQIERIPPGESPSLDVELVQAKRAFEGLAQRMDALMDKLARGERLSAAEQKEINLIYNNAMVLQEIMEGKTPEEFEEAA